MYNIIILDLDEVIKETDMHRNFHARHERNNKFLNFPSHTQYTSNNKYHLNFIGLK